MALSLVMTFQSGHIRSGYWKNKVYLAPSGYKVESAWAARSPYSWMECTEYFLSPDEGKELIREQRTRISRVCDAIKRNDRTGLPKWAQTCIDLPPVSYRGIFDLYQRFGVGVA